jgi:hypothetical protein
MSNLWLNWRFGGWFFQVVRWDDWKPWLQRRAIGRPWRFERVPGRPAKGEGLVSIYQGRVPFALLLMAIVLVVLELAS